MQQSFLTTTPTSKFFLSEKKKMSQMQLVAYAPTRVQESRAESKSFVSVVV